MYASIMLALQKKEEERIKNLSIYKGKGKEALRIEDFTLKTMLGRGGYGKVKQSWEAHIDAKAEVQSLVHPILAT